MYSPQTLQPSARRLPPTPNSIQRSFSGIQPSPTNYDRFQPQSINIPQSNPEYYHGSLHNYPGYISPRASSPIRNPELQYSPRHKGMNHSDSFNTPPKSVRLQSSFHERVNPFSPMYPATHQPTAKRINTLPSTITSFPPRFPWQGNSSFVSHSQRQQTSLNDSPQSSPDKSNATPVTRIQMYSMDSKHDVPDEENEAEMVLTEKQEKKRRKEEKRQRKEEKRKRREEETRINLERQKLKDEEQGRRERDKQHQESRKMKEEERKRKEQEHLRQQEEEEKQQRIRQMEEEARKDEERQKVNTIRKAITRTEDEITSIKREVTELKEKVEEEMKKKEKREEMELRAKQDKEKVKKEEQELTAQIALLSEQIQQEQAKLAHRTQERKEKGILEIELEQALTMKETVSQEIGRVNTKIQELDKETSLLEEECNHLLLVKHEKEKEKLQAWSRWSRLKVENAELMRRVHNTTEILRETEGAWHERNEWYTRVILEDAEAEEKNETGSEPKSRRKRDKGQKS